MINKNVSKSNIVCIGLIAKNKIHVILNIQKMIQKKLNIVILNTKNFRIKKFKK